MYSSDVGLTDLLKVGAPKDERLEQLKSEYELLLRDASERIERMKAYRTESESARPRVLTDVTTGGNTDYGRRRSRSANPTRHDIPLPFGKALTVKHAYRMSGQLPEIIVDRRAETPQERYRSETMERIAWSVVRASQGETTMAAASWDASELGTACFGLHFDIKRQIPVVRRLDPTGVVEVQGIDNPHDFQRVYRSWLVPIHSIQAKYRDSLYGGVPTNVGGLDPYRSENGMALVRLVEMCDDHTCLTFAYGKNSVVGLEEYVHDYGFTPRVIIPNLGPYDNVWGWADYEFVRSLVFYIAQNFSREADVLRMVANGAYVEKGTGQTPEAIKQAIANGGIIPARRDGDITPVQPPDMPSFSGPHMDRAMQYMNMLGFTPPAAWGESSFRSGSAAALQLQPMIEYAGMKQNNWGAGQSRLFGMAYQILEQKIAGTKTYSGAVPPRIRGGADKPFSMQLGSQLEPSKMDTGNMDEQTGELEVLDLPRTPKDLFDGDYTVRFKFSTLVDPNDPSYSAAELNKFTSGAQSLQTTLENLGFQSPEDEMRRIEAEADRFPWINNGMVQMILAQLKQGQQGAGGGQPIQQDLGGAIDTMGGDGGGATSGALNTDAMMGALPGASGPPGGWA